jgi:pSer/pThr/pTyr-binding forkhead associated (FHA) protein
MVGRNEGKEYLISKPVLTIGRSELSDIGLYGDPSIAPTHAVIESVPGQDRHRLRHVAGGQGEHAYPPTVVNGRPVTAEQWLTDGDSIQIGSRTLMFQEKATRGLAPTPAAPPRPVPQSEAARGSLAGPGAAGQETAWETRPPGMGGARPPLAAPPEIVSQMGSAPEVPLTPVLSQFSQAVTQKDLTTTGLGFGGSGSRLTAIAGPYAGQSFPLAHLPVTIGRAKDRDVALPADTSVSRTHARIVYEGGLHQIADDGSSNGTLVNNMRLSSQRPLRSGDVIQLGETQLRYE